MVSVTRLLTQTIRQYRSRMRILSIFLLFVTLLSFLLVTALSFFGTQLLLSHNTVLIQVLFYLTLLVLFLLTVTHMASVLLVVKTPDLKVVLVQARQLILPLSFVTVLAVLAVLVGLIVFIIPGVLCLVWFCLAVPIAVYERKKGFNALWQSRRYVRGHWNEVLWHLTFLSLIYLIPLTVLNSLRIVVVELCYIVVFSQFGMLYLAGMYESLRGTQKRRSTSL